MSPRPTPEEAARGDVSEKFVRVIGVVVRGDEAIVAQLMNDGPVFEIDTAHCFREQDGWVEGSSGNSNTGYLGVGKGTGTVVVWDEAPDWAVAARYALDVREQVVSLENGFVLAVFDDVPEDAWHASFEGWPDRWPKGVPRLVAWVDATGAEREARYFWGRSPIGDPSHRVE